MLSETPVIFSFQSQTVRTVQRAGNPWFIADDVCRVLGIPDAPLAMSALDADERDVVGGDAPASLQDLDIVNESGVYDLIFSSRKPQARAFRRWVTGEVLPAIRGAGNPGQPCFTALSRTSIELLDALRREPAAATRRMLHQQLAHACRLLGVDVPRESDFGVDATGEPPLAGEFWEIYEYIVKADKPVRLNHARSRRLIALSLPHVAREAHRRDIPLAPAATLRAALRGSRNPVFVGIRPVHSEIFRSTVQCWVFDAEQPAAGAPAANGEQWAEPCAVAKTDQY